MSILLKDPANIFLENLDNLKDEFLNELQVFSTNIVSILLQNKLENKTGKFRINNGFRH